MAVYTVQDEQTGKTVTFEWSGEQPPTDVDMEEVFSTALSPSPGEPELMPSHGPQLKASHESTLPDEPSGGPTADSVMRHATRTMAPVYRPVLEVGGMIAGAAAGGAAGIETGPGAIATGVAGAGLGYATGKQAADWLDVYGGTAEPPETAAEAYKQAGEDIITGATYEVGGQLVTAALLPVLRGGKLIFQKAADFGRRALTDAGARKAAGEVLIANTSEGAIYARNAAEAAKLQEQIPGLRFTRGQATNDPRMIKLERSQVRGGGEGSSLYAENVLANNEALRRYYAREFPESEGIDDVFSALRDRQAQLHAERRAAADAADVAAQGVPTAAPAQTGERAVETLKAGEATVVEQAGELYGQVPSMQVNVEGLIDQFSAINRPLYKAEKSGNFPNLLERIRKSMPKPTAKRPTLTQSMTAQRPDVLPRELGLDDLKGMRSELLDEARDTMSGMKPNRRKAARMFKAADAISDTMSAAEGETGAAAMLRRANEFYRDRVVPYRQGGIGKILARGPNGEPIAMDLSQVPGRLWSRNAMGTADKFIDLVGYGEAREIMRDHAAYELMYAARNSAGDITSRGLQRWLSRNKPMLEKFGLEGTFDDLVTAQQYADRAAKVADEFENTMARTILDADPDKAIASALAGNKKAKAMRELMFQVGDNPAAINGLRKSFADHMIAKAQNAAARDVSGDPTMSVAAIKRLMDQHESAMRVLYKDTPQKIQALRNMQQAYEVAVRNTKSPLGGDSPTAEHLLTEIAKVNILSRSATIARGLFGILQKHGTTKANQYVTRSLFDPELAETLISAARSKISPREFRTLVDGQIVRMTDIYDARVARTAASLMSVDNEE